MANIKAKLYQVTCKVKSDERGGEWRRWSKRRKTIVLKRKQTRSKSDCLIESRDVKVVRYERTNERQIGKSVRWSESYTIRHRITYLRWRTKEQANRTGIRSTERARECR
jgi:hypothetical protein